jgi:hypothetical protein
MACQIPQQHYLIGIEVQETPPYEGFLRLICNHTNKDGLRETKSQILGKSDLRLKTGSKQGRERVGFSLQIF